MNVFNVMNAPERVVVVLNGLFAVAVTVGIDTLFSANHLLEPALGFTPSQSHFLLGLLVALVEFIGVALSFFSALIGAMALLVAALAFIFLVGWWAIIPLIVALNTAALLVSSVRPSSPEERLSASPSPGSAQ